MARTDLIDIVSLLKDKTSHNAVSFGYPNSWSDLEICFFSSTPKSNYENQRVTRELTIYVYGKEYDEVDDLASLVEQIDFYEVDLDVQQGNEIYGNTSFLKFRRKNTGNRDVQEGYVQAPNDQMYYQFSIQIEIEYTTN